MTRDDQILSLAPVVHHRAQLAHRDHGGDLDDLIEDGWVGAIEAVDRFDKCQGVKLSTFAAHRIRGSIMDGMRSRDRLTIAHRRALRATGVTPPLTPLSIEQDRVNGMMIAELIVDLGIPACHVDLLGAIQGLPQRDAQIIYQHYYLERTLTAIAMDMGLTVGRISQLLKESRQILAELLSFDSL